MNEQETIVFESVAYGWIGACVRLLSGISIVGVKLVEPDMKYDEDKEKAKTEYSFSAQVDFIDDGMGIGRVDLTRINQDKTLVQVVLDSLPISRLIMYDLRQQNGDIKKRFEKIQETAPTTIKVVVKAVIGKLDSAGLLDKPK